MESVPFTGDAEGREMQEVMAQFDAPAFIRRARGVQAALDHLLEKCRGQRNEWLDMVQLRLGRLHALAGDWAALRPLLAEEDLGFLQTLRTRLSPKLQLPPPPTTSERLLRRSLRELVSSLERFNRRWHAYLEKVDFSHINELREGYNKYYVLEKACALRSDVLARRGFVPMERLTLAELREHLPALPVPKIVG